MNGYASLPACVARAAPPLPGERRLKRLGLDLDQRIA
ncbi:hypothetical protein J2Y70_000753 [Xanthomonas translucens]|nr:hypothetical protein [Xanthomonas translucens]NYF21007.1 hypothetical protein [Xanthomonas sp. JAI131]